MPTECIPERYEFEAFDKRCVAATFDGGTISTDAGTLLSRHCGRAIRLFDRVASGSIDHREPELVVRELPTLIFSPSLDGGLPLLRPCGPRRCSDVWIRSTRRAF